MATADLVAAGAPALAVSCREVTKGFASTAGPVWALRGVELEVPRGGLTMLVGPSGCGKTTLISIIAGILAPDAGRCLVMGYDLEALRCRQLLDFRARHIGFIFQQFHLLPTLSAAENVAVPRIINGASRRDALAAADVMLEQVGLRERRDELPDVLSGGEQQRIAIARALVHDPDLVVCDEPTSALDHATGMKVIELMRRMVRERRTTVLIVTHDNRIFPFADRIAYAVYYTTVLARREPPMPSQLALPPENPYPATVSGSGLIEANTRNIEIGSFVSGIVVAVPVIEGQWVTAGEPLFVLDRRLAEADLAIARRDAAAAEADVAEAEAELADFEDQLRRAEGLSPGVSISADRLARAQFAFRTARAKVEAARASAEVARERVRSAQVTLDRLTVRAPVEGRVLKVNVRLGEFVTAGPVDDPLVLLGNDRPLHVRVQIDENDVWRLKTSAPAEAVVRGNRDLRFPLTFVRVEPYVLPKRSLTGERTERIDTRVLEVIYSFQPGDSPVFIGQQVDVFIKAE